MSDDHAFLAAIREKPDDLALRLVYADWLEERGEERHELIRVEAAMRAVPIWSDEFQRLKPTRNRLRTTLPPDWLATMDYLPKHRPMFGTLPPTAAERWRLAEEFIDIWHGGLKPGDGYTEAEVTEAEERLGVRLPAALREWQRQAGRRQDLRHHVYFVPPVDLRQRPNGLVIREGPGNDWADIICVAEIGQSDPLVSHSDGSSTEFRVSDCILHDLFYAATNRGPSYDIHDAASDEWMPTSRFTHTLIPGWWEAVDAVLGESGTAVCRTEDAARLLAAEYGERVSRLT